MIKTITFSDFVDAFKAHDRQDQFSYNAKRALFDYLENYEEETGSPVELDVIALCCEYTEYEDLAELQKNCPEIKSMEDLQDHTQVIPIENSDSFIIQNY